MAAFRFDATSMISGSGTAISIGGAIFTGGISNSGTLSVGGSGIVVNGPSTFTGGISNSGLISANGAYGIAVSASTFLGGITNSGTISGGSPGWNFGQNSRKFSGWISNAGTISAGIIGIVVSGVTNFIGGIINCWDDRRHVHRRSRHQHLSLLRRHRQFRHDYIHIGERHRSRRLRERLRQYCRGVWLRRQSSVIPVRFLRSSTASWSAARRSPWLGSAC